MFSKQTLVYLCTGLFLLSCADDGNALSDNPPAAPDSTTASVRQVEVSGEPSAYQFSVTVASPDTGCEQYADWWEVVSESGELLYRRVLLHSHVDEQPFIRSGGAVPIVANQSVWVRAHMNNTGYSTQAVRGSVATGFVEAVVPTSFAEDLAEEAPLPDDCNF